MNQIKRGFHFLMDSKIIKLVTIVLFFFLIFPTLKPIMYSCIKIVLLWCAVKFLYDLITKRTFLKARNVGWLLLFIVMEAVTVALNYHVGLKDNLSLLCYTAAAMFVLYPNEEEKDTLTLIREMRLIGMVYIVLCAAASVVSLVVFARGINHTFVYQNILYHTGMFEGRLWGVYSNPNFPAAMIAAALSFMLFPVCHTAAKNSKTLPLQYTVLIVCFLLNFWYAALAQSRGSILSFLLFLFIYFLFLFRKKIFFELRSRTLSVFLSILSAVAIVFVVNFSIPLIMNKSVILPETFAKADSGATWDESGLDLSNSTEMSDTEMSDNYSEVGRNQEMEQENMLTGRSVIWKQAIQKFTQKPVFGFGNVGCTKGITLHNNLEEQFVLHLHNVIIQSLVADGLAGTIPLLVFALLSLTAMVRYIYRHRRDSFENTGILCGCFAFIAFYAANNMIEVFLIYSVSIPHILFWIIFGYMMTLISREQKVSGLDRLMRSMAKAPVTETGK